MMLKIVWAILPLISLTLCQQNPEDYVVQLTFSIREDKIPENIITMLNNSMADTKINTSDIVQLSGLDRYSLDQTVALLAHYNITTEKAFTVDSLQFILDTFGITFMTFYESLTRSITAKTSMDILEDLQIDQAKFTTSLIFGLYDIYDVLREGTYSEENVAKALSTAQKTKEEVFVLSRDIVRKEVIKMKPDEFMAVLASIGLNRRTSLELWKVLGITTSDVYAVENIGDHLKSTIANLNANLTIAVITDDNQLAIHDRVYNFCYVDTSIIKIELANDNEVIGYDGFISPQIVKLRLKNPAQAKIEIASDYSSITNCTYITIAQDSVISEDVEVVAESNTLLVAKKNENTVFNVGSPLVCNDILFGMAADQNDSVIFFDTFFEKGRPDLDDSAEGSGSVMHCQLVVILLLACISSSRNFF